MLAEVFRFEVAYRLRQPSTWACGALLAGIPFLMMHAINGSSSRLNAPATVASVSIALGMIGMLVTATLFGDAATRDVQTGMHPLVYTTQLRERDYLGGRFLGALLVNALLLAGIPLGLAAGSQMPYQDPRMFGPFQAAAYLQPYLLLLLPNLVLTGALLFSIAVLSRQVLPAYLAGVGLLVLYLFAPDGADRVAESTAQALADPFGLAPVNALTRYWTPAEADARLIGFPRVLLWNRLLWMGVAAGILGLLHLRFRFAHPGGAGRTRSERRRMVDAGPLRTGPVVVPPAARTWGPRTEAWQTLAVARRSLEEIARSRAFLAVLCAALLLVFAFGWDVGAEVFGTSTWPVTHLVAATVLAGPVSIVVSVLIALFAGELVWRERDVRVSEISDAAPVPDRASLLGRFLALVAMIVVLQAVLMAAGMILQAVQGYHRYEPGVYLRILFGLKLADYLLFAALAMAVHVAVDRKYLGHIVVMLSLLFTLFAGSWLGIRHNLLVYGSDPGWIYSDMNGFGPFVAPFVWFKLYWASWALLLAVAASLLWVRSREGGARLRLRLARARFTGTAARAAGVAAVLVLGLGGFIFYNTNVLNDYRTPLEAAELRAEYERRYKRFEHAPQPTIAAAKLHVEIHPEERAADLRGTYLLVNRSGAAIDSVHVLVHPDVRARSIRFDRPSRRVLDDRELQYGVHALARPLAPGDSLRLVFDVAFRPRGFPNSDVPTAVAGNGAYFDRRWLPVIGYQASQELTSAEERRSTGLPPRAPTPSAGDAEARRYRFGLRDADLVDIDAVVGTAADQLAVSPGTLVREWRANGRRYFHYRTEAPLSFGVPFLSARYAVREDRWRDVALRVFFHPTHDVNVGRMIRSMKAALEYNSREFGPYPFRELRIVEFPRYASFARAHPHTIAYSEGSSFLTRVEEGDVDRPFFVTAHETAHQWWGNQLRGAQVKGGALLSETLAQYSAMMVMEKMLGREQVRRFYDYEMDRYLRGRTVFTNREVPLLDVDGHAYLYYHKGAVAMYTLREHVGEERVNAALRRFLARHCDAGPPYPTSRDLYAELRAATPDSLKPLLRDLFEEITLWDVRAGQARVEPAAGGFRVTLRVEASKARADSVGTETEVPMNDLVEIGVFADGGSGGGPGEPLYLRRHRVRSGEQTVVVTVPREPARAGIDPYRRLIQREPADNLVEVEAAGAARRGGPRR